MNPSPQEGGALPPQSGIYYKEAISAYTQIYGPYIGSGFQMFQRGFIAARSSGQSTHTAALEREKKLRNLLWDFMGETHNIHLIDQARALLSTQGGPTT